FPVVPLRPLGHLSPEPFGGRREPDLRRAAAGRRRTLPDAGAPRVGGGGGIRTHVGAHHPQLDLESSPVRPLRYPSQPPSPPTAPPGRPPPSARAPRGPARPPSPPLHDAPARHRGGAPGSPPPLPSHRRLRRPAAPPGPARRPRRT